jgi:crossover junction endonuclease MUS81
MLKIDIREVGLIKQCRQLITMNPIFKNIIVTTESLPLGDIIISKNETDLVIVERKSLNDLASSIKDGRYEEQSYRLNGNPHHNHNIIYLIEGDMNQVSTFKYRMDKSTLYSAMFSLNYYKGFSVLRSMSLEETAMILCNMAYKLGKDDVREPFYKNSILFSLAESEPGQNITDDSQENVVESNVDDKDESNYCNVIKKVKKENITPNNIGEIMLSQIPGVSSVTAIAIMQKFGTFANLIASIKEDPKCLKDISYTNAKQQVRKVSKTALQNVVQYLAT